MDTTYIRDVALTFIEERLIQMLNKEPGTHNYPIGKGTEVNFRACLRKIFKNKKITISDKKKTDELSLKATDFIEAGVKKTKEFKKRIDKPWRQRQCDICVKINGIEKIHGEVKTTTSAHHNICILINKNLTAIRLFNTQPLSIIFYPDMKEKTLIARHHEFVKGLYRIEKINRNEYDLLNECFFVLTKDKTNSQMIKQIKKMGVLNPEKINFYRDTLFEDENLNYLEWDRCIKFIKKNIMN